MSDLLNAPGQPCRCDFCTERAYAWAEGPIVERVRERVLSETRFWGRGKSRDESVDAKPAPSRSNRPLRAAGDVLGHWRRGA